MNQFVIFALVSASLFCTGLYGLIILPHLVRKVLALNIMSVGIFLLLVSIAQRNREEAPDPVPQAMVLTGIVVAVSATAVALTIARRLHVETGLTHLSDKDEPT